MAMAAITVIVPTIPTRGELLNRALETVAAQTLQPAGVIVEMDQKREGAATVRNRALDRVSTEFVAFLDDDDELLPNHLKLLARYM